MHTRDLENIHAATPEFVVGIGSPPPLLSKVRLLGGILGVLGWGWE